MKPAAGAWKEIGTPCLQPPASPERACAIVQMRGTADLAPRAVQARVRRLQGSSRGTKERSQRSLTMLLARSAGKLPRLQVNPHISEGIRLSCGMPACWGRVSSWRIRNAPRCFSEHLLPWHIQWQHFFCDGRNCQGPSASGHPVMKDPMWRERPFSFPVVCPGRPCPAGSEPWICPAMRGLKSKSPSAPALQTHKKEGRDIPLPAWDLADGIAARFRSE